MKVALLLIFILSFVLGSDAWACTDCDRDKNTFPIHGTIVSVNAARNTITVDHGASKGLLPPGRDDFSVDAQLLPSLQANQEIIGRIEKKDEVLVVVSLGIVPVSPKSK